MEQEFIGPRRLEPLHVPATQAHAAENTASPKVLQEDAGANADVQVQVAARLEDFTISVDQVREHFRSKGLTKSKDTIQRWCRAGDLDCRKQGVFGRYFVTETSLLALERKLLPDMIAEQSGRSVRETEAVQQDAAAFAASSAEVPLHATADKAVHSGTQVHDAAHAGARSDMKVQEDKPLAASAEVASLRAENSGLKEQLAEAKDNVAFLREEIVSSRGQRGDVVKIANQMLETLETMALGGRLERPKPDRETSSEPVEAVRYKTSEHEVNGV